MRNKKEISYKEDILRMAEDIVYDFAYFTTGYRVLFLIHRNKEGGDTNNTKVRKVIVYNSLEYIDALYGILMEKSKSDLPLRIYASVNERDFEKAIRQFKQEQLDSDYTVTSIIYKN